MFFSNEILTKKGGQFAVVWLVGNFNTVHGSKRLGLKKSDYVSVDVVKACDDMLNPRTTFALRLSSTLLMGIIRIYQKQITIIYDEVKQMWIYLKKGSFMRPENVELQVSRIDTFALPNPLCHYDKEIGNDQSDIRFYTSLGEKALFEAPKESHESRADSAYFTISFGDQEITNDEFERTLVDKFEESPAKRRKISKDSFLDIIEEESTPLKMREKNTSVAPIEIPGEVEFENTANLLDNVGDLNKEFARCSQIADSGLLTDITDPTFDNLSVLGPVRGDDTNDMLPFVPDALEEMPIMNLLDVSEAQFMAEENQEQLQNNTQSMELQIETTVAEKDTTAEETNKEDAMGNKSGEDIREEEDKENVDPNIPKNQGATEMEDLILKELSSRIEKDPILQKMNQMVDPALVNTEDKENVDPKTLENMELMDPKTLENTELMDPQNTVGDEDKENRDPNVAPRRSERQQKIVKSAQEKAFDDTIANITLVPMSTPDKVAPAKRKRKRHLIIDKTCQLSVKEMKKYLKNSRQHLCADPALVHKIVPEPNVLFAEPHRSFIKRVPELMGLWKRCAHSESHDLVALLRQQEDRQKEEAANKSPEQQDQERDREEREEGQRSRKRTRSSAVSEIEIGRFGANSTLPDNSEIEIGRFSRGSGEGNSRDSTTFNTTADDTDRSAVDMGGFRTSTVLKPTRGTGNLMSLSPIQQLNELDESNIPLQPMELLPVMEESSIFQPELSDLRDSLTDIPQPDSTMFGQDTRAPQPDSTMFGQDTIAPGSELQDPTIFGDNAVPLVDETIQEEPERPRTPLIERLSGVPAEQTVQEEDELAKFRYFPHKENQKFFRFVQKKFSGKDIINFEDLVPLSHTKKTAALAFYQLLLLKKYQHVEVSQSDEEYYGKISISLSS